jgi:hypothetical protein
MFPVVVLNLGTFDGETWSKALFVTTRRVSGDINGAFVPSGTASRLTAGGGVPSLTPGELQGSDIIPTAAGVGVTGGIVDFAARFLLGVDGPASFPFDWGSSVAFFRFRLVFASSGAYDPFRIPSLITGKAALKRADLLEAIADSLEVFDGRETFRSPVLCLRMRGRGSLIGRERIVAAS